MTFEELGVREDLLKAIAEMGYENPMPVQEKVIPHLLNEDNDVVALAQTGTGKTAAFGLPVLQRIDVELLAPQALIIAPTRELCLQISGDLADYSKYIDGMKVLPVYGGSSIESQIRAVRAGVQIIVATPGRLIDLIERKVVQLGTVHTVILDEADEMLNMGFVDDINNILSYVPEERKMLMFSATMPPEIAKIAARFMHNPEEYVIGTRNEGAENVRHIYYLVHARDKYEALKRVADSNPNIYGIIFCRTRRDTQEIADHLIQDGSNADSLHGDLSQQQRDMVMKKFREGACDVLIATDVAARGIDIDNITHVINFDIPQDPESYVHRIGRTGRAGNTGVAMTFITPREFRQLKLIERMVKTKIQRRQLPTAANVIERQRDQIISKMQTVLELNAYHDYMPIAESLLDDYSAEEVAAAALKLMQEGVKALEAPQEDVLAKDLQNTGGRPGMVRLFMNVGRSQKIMVKDIVSTIAIEADIPARDIGLINIYDKFTFVEVPEDVAEKVIGAMHKNFIKGYRINIEPAKVRERR